MGQTTNTYIMLFSGVSLLFYFAGLVDSNPFLDLLLNPENLTTTGLYGTLVVAVGGVAAVIALGIVTRNTELAVMTAITLAMVPILWNFMSVYKAIASINEVLGLLFFAPIMFLFTINIIDFWRGRD